MLHSITTMDVTMYGMYNLFFRMNTSKFTHCLSTVVIFDADVIVVVVAVAAVVIVVVAVGNTEVLLGSAVLLVPAPKPTDTSTAKVNSLSQNTICGEQKIKNKNKKYISEYSF